MALESNDLIQQNPDGKAMLSCLDDEDVKEILVDEEIHPYAANRTTRLDLLLTELRVIRRRGDAVDNEEIEIGLGCIGAPIKEPTGAMVGEIGTAAPSARLPAQPIHRVGKLVMAVAEEISLKLGF